MRGFFSRTAPTPDRILLIESGPRELGEAAVARLQAVFGPGVRIDALHCQTTPPVGAGQAWSVADAAWSRGRLLRTLRRERYPVAALLAGGDAIMGPWRWATLLWLPSKFLVVNENADFFWLDRGHLGVLVRFAQQRSGLAGESALRSLLRAAALPFVFLYLLIYAGFVHLLRGLRLALGMGRTA